ncbi:MAG: rRNA maturation RNase YbeY [Rhodospirillales bacterium]
MDTQSLSVDVEITNPAWRTMLADPAAFCRDTLSAAFGFLDYPPRTYEVSVLLSDDAAQQTLNARYREKDSATNVLSFPSGESAENGFPDEIPLPLGDICLAYETLVREAGAGRLSFADHFCHLLVHGMLHLAGYDHENDDDAEQMEMLEIEVLASMGVDNPYQRGTMALQK